MDNQFEPLSMFRGAIPMKVLAISILEGNGTEELPLCRVTYYIDTETGRVIGKDGYPKEDSDDSQPR